MSTRSGTVHSEQFTHAERNLAWLDQRDHALTAATQDDIDTWHAQALPSHKHARRGFLTWAIASRLMPRLALPPLRTPNTGQRITQSRRLALLRRILTDDTPPLRSRVAGCLMLLYAQPVSRIVRLSIDDIIQDNDGQARIRLGPQLFTAVIRSWVSGVLLRGKVLLAWDNADC